MRGARQKGTGTPASASAGGGGTGASGCAGGAAGAALKEAGRQMLHAVNLAFDHPITGQHLALTAPLFPDFRALLKALVELEPSK